MKSFAIFTIVLFLFPDALLGQSTLNFGYVIGLAEMSKVGIAVVNPSPAAAPTTFTLYGTAGDVIRTTAFTIPAGGQLARTGREIFPTADKGGWVQATSAITGLRAFWLAGDFATFTDGAEAASPASEMVLPIITDQSDISLLNTGTNDTAILLRLYSETGQELAEPSVSVLPPKGSFRAKATTLFSPLDWSAVTHARISSGSPVVASAAISNFRVEPSLAVANAISIAPAVTDFALPHVLAGILGTTNYTTTIGVTNISTVSQNVTLTFFPDDGSPSQIIQQSLPGNGGFRLSARTLFQFPNTFQSGWVRVTSPLGTVGFAANIELQQNSIAITEGLPRAQNNFIFGHIADLPPWWTGLALVNPGQANATVEIYAVSPDGKLIGGADDVAGARFVIPPNRRIARLLTEWIPQTQSRTLDGGFVFVRSTAPLYGLSLFFTRDLQVLSIVPAFDLPPGVVFTPPSPIR